MKDAENISVLGYRQKREAQKYSWFFTNDTWSKINDI